MPTPPPNPFVGVTDPCALAVQMQAALMQLMSGGTPSAVTFGDQEMRFSRSNIPEMRAEIARLNAMCASRHGRGRAVRMGPHARWLSPRNWGAPYGGYGGY